jgi:hypothetical protein
MEEPTCIVGDDYGGYIGIPYSFVMGAHTDNGFSSHEEDSGNESGDQ